MGFWDRGDKGPAGWRFPIASFYHGGSLRQGFPCRTPGAVLLFLHSLLLFFQKRKQCRISFDTLEFAAEEVCGAGLLPVWDLGGSALLSVSVRKKPRTKMVLVQVLPALAAL